MIGKGRDLPKISREGGALLLEEGLFLGLILWEGGSYQIQKTFLVHAGKVLLLSEERGHPIGEISSPERMH